MKNQTLFSFRTMHMSRLCFVGKLILNISICYFFWKLVPHLCLEKLHYLDVWINRARVLFLGIFRILTLVIAFRPFPTHRLIWSDLPFNKFHFYIRKSSSKLLGIFRSLFLKIFKCIVFAKRESCAKQCNFSSIINLRLKSQKSFLFLEFSKLYH